MKDHHGTRDKEIPQLRSFAASRNPTANRFINRLHLNDDKRLLTKPQLKMVLWECLGIDLKVAKYKCTHCDTEQCVYYEHAETCKKSRKNTSSDNKTIYYTRAHALHSQGKSLLKRNLNMAADIHVDKFEPHCSQHFGYTEVYQRQSNNNDHHGKIIGFAMDARGGLSPAAALFIYHCYKRYTNKNPRS